ncbi:MAG: class II D-tagatose-bisphosphate aldolase, non-catalytic subunit [Bacillota bacterium]|nr:class II D-tagatose-bisphosphate aldolase, non-catalytic subunit [Bacillota bacterium]
MHNQHYLKEIVKLQKQGIPKGIYSVCSANEYVIEAAMERALKANEYVLVEATANQVNQFGGYTGMRPTDFKNFVYSLATRVGFPLNKIILGGDHLGPLTWQNESSNSAMEKSRELIRQYVLAGFTKIHIDTSMRLADDSTDKQLDTEVIAQRGAILCKEAEEAFAELKKCSADASSLVYIVGSEVPIPGGSQNEEEGVQVTKVSDFKNTVEEFKKAFSVYGLEPAWEKVIGVVVQPGVEFGDESIHEYNREVARDLKEALKEYPSLVFEGHSTDYQTATALKQMVEDGIAILKVGPALTFALREGLFALNLIENELFKRDSDVQISNFINVLEDTMVKNPTYWKNHYHGDVSKLSLARKYSLSDRCRYYLPSKELRESIKIMMNNLNSVQIPLTLISEFLPIQYGKIRNGLLKNTPEEMLKDRIINYIDDYMHAVIPS